VTAPLRSDGVDPALRDSYRGVFDGRVGFGRAPALLIVDFIRAYTTPGLPLYAPAVSDAVEATRALLALARARALPVIFTRVAYSPSAIEGGVFVHKVPLLRTLTHDSTAAEIVPALAPAANELVLTKQYASAFFGTPLAATLTSLGVDTVILCGCSTSGCVRASAVDGMQHGFRVIVPRQCVADRASAPHEANLFDIDSKYGDVVDRAAVLRHLDGGTA
jgi:nicotinamidase-related amidase